MKKIALIIMTMVLTLTLVGCDILDEFKKPKVEEIEVVYVHEAEILGRQKYKDGEVLKLLAEPKIEGSEFIGWYDQNQRKVEGGHIVTEHLILSAKYKVSDVKKYTIKFYVNEELKDIEVFNEFQELILPKIKEDGYVIVGWFYENGEEAKDGDLVERSQTITAETEKIIIKDVSIKFYEVEEFFGKPGSPITFYAPDAKDLDGKIFVGWFDENDKNFEEYREFGNVDIIFYAKYKNRISEVEYIFDDGEEIISYKGEIWSDLDFKQPEAPKKEESVFIGWFDENDKNFKEYKKFGDKNMTFYPKYKEVDTVEDVEYVFDDGEEIISYKGKPSEKISFERPVGSKKDGYEFVGWFDSQGKNFDEYSIFGDSDQKFVARYEEVAREIDVTYLTANADQLAMGMRYKKLSNLNVSEFLESIEMNNISSGNKLLYLNGDSWEDLELNSKLFDDIIILMVRGIDVDKFKNEELFITVFEMGLLPDDRVFLNGTIRTDKNQGYKMEGAYIKGGFKMLYWENSNGKKYAAGVEYGSGEVDTVNQIFKAVFIPNEDAKTFNLVLSINIAGNAVVQQTKIEMVVGSLMSEEIYQKVQRMINTLPAVMRTAYLDKEYTKIMGKAHLIDENFMLYFKM